jgi:hypothetical protein
MKSNPQNSANSLITKIHQLFSPDLALENDYLRQENKILRSKLGSRVPLTEADRRLLVQHGLRIKYRLAEVISIVKPETLLAWNRRQKQKKCTFDNHSAKAGRPRKADDAFSGPSGGRKQFQGLQANLWGVKETRTQSLPHLPPRDAKRVIVRAFIGLSTRR